MMKIYDETEEIVTKLDLLFFVAACGMFSAALYFVWDL